jgi:DNA-binding response OmpR family regulator
VQPLLVYPDPPPPELAQALDLAGWIWKGAASPEQAKAIQPEGGWSGCVLWALPIAERAWQPSGPEGAFAMCRALRHAEPSLSPLLLVTDLDQLAELELREDLFDDFCVVPFHPAELETRLRHAFWRTGRGTRPELVEYGPLVVNVETYQAAVAGHPLDLTYMEYQLLRFLITHRGRVFTREALLSRVWGYEYYGGARTVDVHIRRLRAKLGDQHAHLIHTVRSVGYRLGQGRWG